MYRMFNNALRNESYKAAPRDVVYTPDSVVDLCLAVVDPLLVNDDLVCDAFAGKDAFLKKFSARVQTQRCEIEDGTNFFDLSDQSVDWIISNPPYSNLNGVLTHSARICRKGFAYLICVCNLTPARISNLERLGFYLHTIKFIRINHWFGISVFCIWTRESPPHGTRFLYHPIQIDDPAYTSRRVSKKLTARV